MEYLFWLLVVAGGPLLLAAAFAYALVRRRRLTAREKAAQHEAIDEIYHSDAEEPESSKDRPATRKEMAD